MTTLPHHSPASPRPTRSDVWHGSSSIVLDWSHFEPTIDGARGEMEELLSWVSSCPRPSGIRVYLPSVRDRSSVQRLQRALQALGCTVTCRTVPLSA